jgi:hypothetical protein
MIETIEAPKVSKQKRKRRKVHLFPRVIKRDIRRQLPYMLANALNASDSVHLSHFLDRFCRPECSLIDDFPKVAAMLGMNTFRLSLLGINNLILHFTAQMEAVPDFAVRLHSSAIKQYLHEPRSEIICKVSFLGTKVFDLIPSESAQHTSIGQAAMIASSTLNLLQSLRNNDNNNRNNNNDNQAIKEDEKSIEQSTQLLVTSSFNQIVQQHQHLFPNESSSTIRSNSSPLIYKQFLKQEFPLAVNGNRI